MKNGNYEQQEMIKFVFLVFLRYAEIPRKISKEVNENWDQGQWAKIRYNEWKVEEAYRLLPKTKKSFREGFKKKKLMD